MTGVSRRSRQRYAEALVAFGWIVSLAASARATETAEAPPIEVLQSVKYAEPADKPLTADVYLPRGEGPFPGVLVVHGGAWVAGSKGRMSRIGTSLAERGYVAVSIDYRLAPKHKFPAQLDDCRAALGWMRDNAAAYRLDPRRIGGFGYSAGAHLVTLLSLSASATLHDPAAASSDRAQAERYVLQAVVAGGTPCDFQELPLDSKRLTFWLGGTRRDKADLYRQASPLAFVTPHSPPMMLYHGEKDLLVPLLGARTLKQSLDKAGVACELLIVEKAGHISTFTDAPALAAAADFLDRHLRVTPETNAQLGSPGPRGRPLAEPQSAPPPGSSGPRGRADADSASPGKTPGTTGRAATAAPSPGPS